jgi:DNA-binding transcriptional LysR family regulator
MAGIIRMDINGHDLPLLASLRVMLDEKNVTRAAARLGISQPALSAQLARLRDIFRDQLLTPASSGKGMVLTPRGAALKEPLRDALLHLEAVVSEPPVFDPAKSQRTLTLGANDNASAIVGTRLIQRLCSGDYPDIKVALRGVDPAKLIDQLEAGEIDIALVTKNALPKGLPHQRLFQEKFMMAQRRHHPRGEKRPSLREYTRLDHVIVSGDGGGFRSFVDTLLQEKGLERRVVVSVQYYSIVPLILESTDLVCTLPAQFLSRYAERLTSLPLPFEAGHFTLYATWHPRFDGDPPHNWLRTQLAGCLSN